MTRRQVPVAQALICTGLALIPSAVSAANDIEEGKEFYTAIKTPNPIVIDGNVEEWGAAARVADPRFWTPKDGAREDQTLINFETYQGGDWTGPDDHTSVVQVVYDDDNVYFGFVVTDEYHENAANSGWNGDSVQLMIANAARDFKVALYNYGLGGVEGALGDVVVHHEEGPGGTTAAIVRDAETKRTTYEIQLPKEALDLDELRGGVQFGLGMAINDGDEATPGQKGWGGLGAHSIVHGKSPEHTALVTLATANDIESGKEFYTANPIPGEFMLDGVLDEWTGVSRISDPRFWTPKDGARENQTLINFETYQGGDWTGPDDHTSTVQVAYDADNVYFGFVVTDEYHENSANSGWNGDSVQLMIANDKQDFRVALYNYGLGGVEGALGDVVVHHEEGPGGTAAAIVRDSVTNKTTYEIQLPKASLDLEALELGTMFGLGMAINDGDEATPGQKGWGGLGAHSIVHGKSPEHTALVTLGVGGSSGEVIFLSAISAGLHTFSFRVNDNGSSLIDPDSAMLTIDGEVVELVASEKNLGATDFVHTFAAPYPTGSEHTFTIQVEDNLGNVVTETSTFVAPIFGVITPDMMAGAGDPSQPGFVFKMFQSSLYEPASLDEVEVILAGGIEDLAGPTDNDADPAQLGIASAPGTTDANGLVEFNIPGTVNLGVWDEQDPPLPPTEFGNFTPDDPMPGVPGTFDDWGGASVEFTTYVELPAGFITLGVNSDDGFRMEAGPFDQPDARELLGEWDSPRGAADSLFDVMVEEAGVYPIRTLWTNGAGDANIEIFAVIDGVKVLLNDTASGGYRAYRSVGGAPAADLVITAFNYDSVVRQAEVTWASTPGATYRVERSNALGQWETVADEYPEGGATGGTTSFTDATIGAGVDRGFYRVREAQ